MSSRKTLESLENREYGFRARIVWKKWVSPEDCLAEYERWTEGLGERKGE